MNNKVNNPKTEVDESILMNEKDCLTDMLETEKNMRTNISIALNEASNENLYNEIYTTYEEVGDVQRQLFELMFKKGWYCLEKADNNKIKTSYNKCLNSIENLNK